MGNTNNIAKKLIFIITIAFTFIIFIQNFLTSSSFDILSLRTFDDVAFHSTLRSIHKSTSIWQLFVMNDYGYGWIFWAPIALVTYPAYLLQQASGVDWLLIVLPRMISLVYALGCVVLMYKIVSVYTKNQWIKFSVVVLLPVFPTYAYFSGRFGTVCQSVFFSMLSVYLLVKYEQLDRKKIRFILIVFAVALGTKLSNIVLFPILTLLILSRYQWKFNKDNYKVWIPEIFLAVIATFIFISPAIFLAPVKPELAMSSIRTILFFIKNSQGHVELISNIKGLISSMYYIPVFIGLIIGLLLKAFRDNKLKEDIRCFDFAIMLIGYIIGCIYLTVSIGQGWIYVIMYSLPISFVLPLGLLALDRVSNKQFKIFSMIICITISCLQGVYLYKNIKNYSLYNPLRYFQDAMNDDETIRIMDDMKRTIMMTRNKEESINILIDARLPAPISPLDHDDLVVYSIWDNLQDFKEVTVNYIILDKDSKGFMSEADFNNAIVNISEEKKETYVNDRNSRITLLQKNEFLGKKWSVLEETDRYFIYKIK